MQEKEINITPQEIEKFRELGLLNETGLRNLLIKRRFRLMSTEEPGKKKCVIIQELAEEYNLSPEAINQIVYRKKRYRKVFECGVDL